MKDLFKHPELIPDKVKRLLGNHTDELEYEELEHLQHDISLLGYTFDFDLHCEVSNLRIKSSLDYIIQKSGYTNTVQINDFNELPEYLECLQINVGEIETVIITTILI